MRGKGISDMLQSWYARITPAHAGKSLIHIQITSHRADHPRPCGEKLAIFALVSHAGGSPPPMRGKEPAPDAPAGAYGITPAHAGKRISMK